MRNNQLVWLGCCTVVLLVLIKMFLFPLTGMMTMEQWKEKRQEGVAEYIEEQRKQKAENDAAWRAPDVQLPSRYENNLSPEAELDRIWKYVNERQYNCNESEYLGGRPLDRDGAYDLCIEDKFWPVRKNPDHKCLMYSFGVGNDWSFDDEIAKRGCEVHAFDPSMDRLDDSPLGDHGVRFHKIGISGTDIDKDANGWKMRTFSTLLKELGHNGRWMDYLKVDTDAPGGGGFEDMIMQELLDTGLYSCVRQYSMEIHLMGPLTQKRWLDRSRNIYNQMTQLNDHGWRLYNKTDNVRAAKIVLKRPDFSQDEMRPRALNGAEEILWETSFVNFDVKGPCLVK